MQLPLLSIRKQPEQKAPAISSKTIRAYVRENLTGFWKRQQERERVRAIERERWKTPTTKRPALRSKNVRAIKVTYRAVFTGPKPPINPSGWKVPGTFPVELFQSNRSHWKAREIGTARRMRNLRGKDE